MGETINITTMVTANVVGESREQADVWFDGFIKGVAMGGVIAKMPEAAIASLIDEAKTAFRKAFPSAPAERGLGLSRHAEGEEDGKHS